MRILVTGAGGYIGRHLVPRLRDEGHEVLSYHTTFGSEIDGRLYYRVDLACEQAVNYMMQVHQVKCTPYPDTVIHLAGRVEINLLPNPKGAHLPPVPGPCDIVALYRDNVLATANVLDYCLKAGVKHLIFASTQAVYGMLEVEDDTDYKVQPLEPYATSKLAAEQLLETGRGRGLLVDIVRLPGVYGGDRRDGAVYQMCRDAVQKGVVTMAATYPLPINVLHIEDVVTAFCNVVTNGAEYGDDTSDLTGHEPCSLSILAKEIGELTGAEVQIAGVEQPVADMWFYGNATAPCLRPPLPKPRKERLQQVLEEIRREP